MCEYGVSSGTVWSSSQTFTTQSSPTPSPSLRVKETDKLADLEMDLFPNPNSGMFNLLLNQSNQYNIMIMDFRGQLVYSRTAVEFQQNKLQEIDASHLAKGVYFLKLESDTDLKVKRIVIK